MFCKVCGAQIADNAELCPNCGTQVGASQGASQEFRTYSPMWANQQDQYNVAPQVQPMAPMTDAPKAKKKSPLLKVVVALVLVAAIVFGIAAIAGNKPASKAFDALRKTVFESSEITITSYDANGDEELTILLTVGDDINSTYLDEKVGGQSVMTLKNGKMHQYGQELGSLEDVLDIYTGALSEELGTDINIADEANKILNNKIDEDAVAELYNTTVRPILEKSIKEETGLSVELPEYDECMKFIEKLLKDKDVRKSLGIKKAKSDNPGKTYSYDVNCGDFATAFFEFVQDNKEYNEYLELVVEASGYDSAEELIADVVKDAYESDNLQGTFTLKSGRLTNFTVEEDGEVVGSVKIESKK